MNLKKHEVVSSNHISVNAELLLISYVHFNYVFVCIFVLDVTRVFCGCVCIERKYLHVNMKIFKPTFICDHLGARVRTETWKIHIQIPPRT